MNLSHTCKHTHTKAYTHAQVHTRTHTVYDAPIRRPDGPGIQLMSLQVPSSFLSPLQVAPSSSPPCLRLKAGTRTRIFMRSRS